jgi:hypothetical protein
LYQRHGARRRQACQPAVNPIVAGALNRISQDVDMVTIRFNYRFGGYGGYGGNGGYGRY